MSLLSIWKPKKTAMVSLLLTLASGSPLVSAAVTQKPNIFFLLTDDQDIMLGKSPLHAPMPEESRLISRSLALTFALPNSFP
jgi:hypothetical protein